MSLPMKAQSSGHFGCGGNRDKGKRPLMGEIACRLADWLLSPTIIQGMKNRHLSGERFWPVALQTLTCVRSAIVPKLSKRVLVNCNNMTCWSSRKGHESGQIIGRYNAALRRRRHGAKGFRSMTAKLVWKAERRAARVNGQCLHEQTWQATA